jgi:hypothetical protein
LGFIAFQKLWNNFGAYGGVNTITRFSRLLALAALFLAVSAFASDETLLHARRAQALLGSEVWSRVIRIENDKPSAKHPRIVHGLIFELADILWFFNSAEGTQSFSLHRNRLAEEKANFAPLLRDVYPGFNRWTVLDDTAEVPGSGDKLPNGCFIHSVVALRDRLLAGGEAVRPHLLSYYIDTRAGLNGHTVLAYEANGRVEVIDATRTNGRFNFPATLARDALKLARAIEGTRVAAARFFALESTATLNLFTQAVAAAVGVTSSG